MIVVGTPLVTRKNCAASMWMSFAMNATALTMPSACCWAGPASTVRLLCHLMSLKAMGMPWLTLLYSVSLMLCLISTGVTTVFGFTARFSEMDCLKKITGSSVKRSALVTLFIICLSMTVSMVGLTNIIKYGYGYCGYLAIASSSFPS